MRFRELKLRKDPDCPVCGTHPTVTKLIDYDQFCGVHPPQPEPVTVNNATEITAVELKQRLDRGDRLTIRGRPRAQRVSDQPHRRVGVDPAGRHAEAIHELDPNEEIVMQCKIGGRSAKAADFLRSVGFKRVLNLTGGIWTGSIRLIPASRSINIGL